MGDRPRRFLLVISRRRAPDVRGRPRGVARVRVAAGGGGVAGACAAVADVGE